MPEPELAEFDGEEVYSPEELCAFAKISMDTLQRYRRAEKGPPEIKIGAAVRFLKSDVIGWLKSLRVSKGDADTVFHEMEMHR